MITSPINWRIAKHPINYLVIGLMLVIAATAGHLLMSYFGHEPKTGVNSYTQLPTGLDAQTNAAASAPKASGYASLAAS